MDYKKGTDRDNLSDPSRSKFVDKINERLQIAWEAELLAQQEAQRQKK